MPDVNVILTPQVMAELALFSLGNKLHIARNMSNEVTKEFAKPSYKVGNSVEVRKPYRFVGGEGLPFDPEPLVDQVTPVVVNRTPHVHFQWNVVEKTLDIREAMRLYGDPAGTALATKINSMAATHAAQNALNSVGTPGIVPNNQATYLAAGDVLTELGLPEGEDLNLIVNRRMSTGVINGTVGYFNPQDKMSAAWNKGVLQPAWGYKLWRDQTINTHTCGTWTAVGLVNGANQTTTGGNNSTMTLNTDGWTSSGTTLNKGDKFVLGSDTDPVIGGVMSVYPQGDRASTGRQQVFTVENTISDTTGTVNMVVAPGITPTTLGLPASQYANVDISPVDNAIITMIGTSGQISRQGLLMHQDAFAFVSVPMEEVGPGVKMTQIKDPMTGLSIAYSVYGDGNNMITKQRYDGLVGFGNMYRELCCVVQS